ncbi:amino acid permease [bacterium]|nr:amino acid permease [bacterium]
MSTSPRPHLTVADGTLLIIGLVVGTGVLRVPASIAQQTTGPGPMLGAWLLGALFAGCGAYCYAQLCRLYPRTGGEYAYLHGSWGATVAFLFAWSRATVLQTGSIAATAFIFGDYAAKLLSLGPGSATIYALLAVIALSAVNALGLRSGKLTQNLLTAGKLLGLLLIVGAGLMVRRAVAAPLPPAEPASGGTPMFGLAMVFVLYAYGGWNEASYLSGDVKRGSRDLAAVLFLSTGLVALVYVLVHLAYVHGLGFEGLKGSAVPAADVARQAFGRTAELVVAALAALIALGTANATIFTGSRTLQALSDNHPGLQALGACPAGRSAPVNAFCLQGLVAAALVLVAGLWGQNGRHGFESAVEYTAPAFWGFMTLIGLVAVKLAWRHPQRPRPSPAFLVTAVLFVAMDLYMLHSSIAYVGRHAVLSLAVVALGLPVYWLVSRADRRRAADTTQATAEAEAEPLAGS